MFLTEFNQEEYDADVRADGIAIGLEEGRMEGRMEERLQTIQDQIGRMQSRNYAAEEIAELLGLTAEEQAEFL